MAFSILIRKISEDAAAVEYAFADGGATGRLKIDKASGETSLLEAEEDDRDRHVFQRACWKLWQHRERGEYPEQTCWAS